MKLIKILLMVMIFGVVSAINPQKTHALLWNKTPLNSTTLRAVEQTPFGILAGEQDTRLWKNPYNGIYVSKDIGETWEELGLAGTGITNIKFFENNIYATTYYYKNGQVGLYYSNDYGNSWNHLGPNFSASVVNVDNSTIYLGGYQQGLWVSHDNGNTWEQKIGENGVGPEIKTIESSENITFVSTTNSVYKTNDHGNTWVEVEQLKNKTAKNFLIDKKFVLAGMANSNGLYKSNDMGTTWYKIDVFGNNEIQAISQYKNNYFVATNNKIYTTQLIDGLWDELNLQIADYNKIIEITWIYGANPFVFCAVLGDGIYKIQIEESSFELNQFMSPPWEIKTNNDLIDKITSFFDHSYPLLGYNYYSEPIENQLTTLNFFGQEETEPALYYSSHDGIDYALPYGTPIKAVASGYATNYYCVPCGNTIKINHQNGYQTTYMHLQDNGLITTNNIPVWVEEGTIIGKVGSTGNTTGPHLHFNVKKDTTQNGNFNDELPVGNTDPYGWQTTKIQDPWADFLWTDTLGKHNGTSSSYLWKILNEQTKEFIKQKETTIIQDNKQIKLPLEYIKTNATLFLKSYIQPKLWNLSNTFKYIENTSMLIELVDQLENNIDNLDKPVKIIIDLNNLDISNVLVESLKLYFFDNAKNEWITLPTLLDLSTNTLTAETNHFSKFAVFGEINNTEIKKLKIINGTFTIN